MYEITWPYYVWRGKQERGESTFEVAKEFNGERGFLHPPLFVSVSDYICSIIFRYLDEMLMIKLYTALPRRQIFNTFK